MDRILFPLQMFSLLGVFLLSHSLEVTAAFNSAGVFSDKSLYPCDTPTAHTLPCADEFISNEDSWALPSPMLVNEISLSMPDAKLTVPFLNSTRNF